MKSIFKNIIVYVLEWESRLVLQKYKPKIVAVTGSVGKTSTKDAIYTILSPHLFVRKSEKSFNSEIGVPLTILGCQNGWNNPLAWFRNIMHGLELIVFKNNYPKCLVLEVGADKPGDIKRTTKYVKPDVTVVTRIGAVPVHVEFFPSRDDLITEKGYLVKALKKDGTLILNVDDEDVIKFKTDIKNKVITYGIINPADITASNERIIYEEVEGLKKPVGFGFKVNFGGNSVPLMLRGVLGLQHLYPVLAAVAVGSSQNLNMVEITQAMSDHLPPRGRMNLLDGIHNSSIIDDTYNASPIALNEALDAFSKIEVTGKKIAVLGDMMELGKFSNEEHKNAGQHVASLASLLVTVGLRARLMAEGAAGVGMKKRSIVSFDNSHEAADYVKKGVKKGDLVLVKGSQSTRMERVVEAILENPEMKGELLVRQEPEWLAKK